MTICQVCGEELPPGVRANKRYCSGTCYKRAKVVVRKKNRPRRFYLGTRAGKPVQVEFPDCADPYFISLHEYEMYRAAYERMPGVKVTVTG